MEMRAAMTLSWCYPRIVSLPRSGNAIKLRKSLAT